MVTLGDLPATEIQAFVNVTVTSFIDDLVDGGIDRNAAETAIDANMRRLLPDGIDTQGHRFRSVISELDPSMVVRLGLNVFESNSTRVALYESLGFVAGNVTDSGREMWLHVGASR